MDKNMKIDEEYYWKDYTKIYSNQVINMTDEFIIKNAEIKDGKINWNGDAIHPNIKFIMEYILKVNAESVFECGFGGGQYIYSIKKLFPNISVGGVELLDTQIEFGINHFNIDQEFFHNDRFSIGDWSIPDTHKLIAYEYDVLYTNAVIMHLNTEKAVSFIKNMIGMNPKHIVMSEGNPNHDWDELYRLTNILDNYNTEPGEFRVFVRKNI
jgi:hypothetical protein